MNDETNNTNEQEPEQPTRRRFSGIFDDADSNGSSDFRESEYEKEIPQYQTVEIDGDEYDFLIEPDETPTRTAKNAPTTRIENLIDEGMEVSYLGHYNAFASESEAFVWNEDSQETEYQFGYRLALCDELMPPFETKFFNNIQDLANAMRDIADLRTWRKSEPEY